MPLLARTAPFLAAAWLLAMFTPALQAADRMAVGQWEFALTTDDATHTSKHCVTQEEAGRVNGSTASAREHSAQSAAKGHCSIKSFDIQSGTVSYALTCGKRLIESTGTYHGDTFEGVLTTTTEGKAVETRVKARRLGDCP